MRRLMREADARRELNDKDQERKVNGFRKFEKWRKVRGFQKPLEKLYETNQRKAINLSVALENQKRVIESLNPTMVSTQFGTTPENLLKIVTIPYLNSVGGDIFEEITLETMNDVIWYLEYVYGKTARGVTEDDKMMDSAQGRYVTEEDTELVDAAGAGTSYSGTLTNPSVVPYKVFVVVDGTAVYANDNGSEVISGSYTPIGGSANAITGTIDYDTGDYTLVFATAPNVQIDIQYNYNSEDPDNYDSQGNVNLSLTPYRFVPRPRQLGVSWSLMAQFTLDSTLGVDSEAVLYDGAGYEMTKSSDVMLLRSGYKEAKKKAPVTWDSDWASAGADSEAAYVKTFFAGAIRPAGQKTYVALNRGGLPTSIYGGYKAIDYITKIEGFVANENAIPQGCYLAGTLNGIAVYQVPTTVCPDNEIVTVYKNKAVPNDTAIIKGTFIPLASTEMLEFKNLYRERAFYSISDTKTLQTNYIQRIQITNLPTY